GGRARRSCLSPTASICAGGCTRRTPTRTRFRRPTTWSASRSGVARRWVCNRRIREVTGAPQAAGLPHVVIIGGGFAGLYAAKALNNAPVRVTLVDRRNHHLFQPMLYQVATAGLNPSDVASPIRSILRHSKPAQ